MQHHLGALAAGDDRAGLIAASAAEVSSETAREQSPRCALCVPGNAEPTTAEPRSSAATTDSAAGGHSIKGSVTFSGLQSDPSRTVAYLASNDTLDSAAGQPGTAIIAQEHKVFKPSSGQWLGHVLAFDAKQEKNAWPLFIESERSVVLDSSEDPMAELQAEYEFMEENNREFVNFGAGASDFTVNWY